LQAAFNAKTSSATTTAAHPIYGSKLFHRWPIAQNSKSPSLPSTITLVSPHAFHRSHENIHAQHKETHSTTQQKPNFLGQPLPHGPALTDGAIYKTQCGKVIKTRDSKKLKGERRSSC
jgi:hypothetical protein